MGESWHLILAVLSLGVVSFAIAWVVTFAMKRIAPRLGFVDKPGGRKIHANPKPLGGGVAIFLAFALPLLVGLAVVKWGHPERLLPRSWLLHADRAVAPTAPEA